MKYLYRLYQLLVCLPIFILASVITSLTTVVGCIVGDGHFGDIILENGGRV